MSLSRAALRPLPPPPGERTAPVPCAIYARKSLSPDAEESVRSKRRTVSVSIEDQESGCLEWVNEHPAWRYLIQPGGVVIDDLISGASSSRVGRDTILVLAETGAIAEVVVWRLDRWSREDVLEVVSLIADLRRLGVVLWVADEPDLDPYNTDYAEELIRSAQYARRELLTTRRRTTQGLARRKAAGVYLGHLPFGWRPVGGDRANGIEPDPAQHATLLSIYTSRVNANGWTRMEALHKMTHGSLKEIVKRERNRTVVGDDLWERANKAGVSPFRAGRAYLYRGLVRCPSCGMRMMGNDREGRRYYWCSHQHRPHPYGRSVRTWTLDTALRAEVGRLVFSDRLRARIVAKLSAGSRGTSRTVLWDRRNADLDNERAFIAAQLGTRLTEAEFDERAAKIAVGRQALGARPMEAMAASAAIEEIASFISAIPSSDDPPQEINFGNGILREWLDRITLSDTKQPTFHWREPWRTIIAASRKPSGRIKGVR